MPVSRMKLKIDFKDVKIVGRGRGLGGALAFASGEEERANVGAQFIFELCCKINATRRPLLETLGSASGPSGGRAVKADGWGPVLARPPL